MSRPQNSKSHASVVLRRRSLGPLANQPELELILQRLHSKQLIVEQLIDGRLSLLDAAARFRSVCRLALPGEDRLDLTWRMPEDGEAICRTLIGWAQLALADRPERAESLTTKFEYELEEHLTEHGSISLC